MKNKGFSTILKVFRLTEKFSVKWDFEFFENFDFFGQMGGTPGQTLSSRRGVANKCANVMHRVTQDYRLCITDFASLCYIIRLVKFVTKTSRSDSDCLAHFVTFSAHRYRFCNYCLSCFTILLIIDNEWAFDSSDLSSRKELL